MSHLKKLAICDLQSTTSLGDGAFLAADPAHRKADVFSSINPTTEEVLAELIGTSQEEYEQVMKHAVKTFQSWRLVPAPKRGLLIKAIGNALREKKDLLGTLISLEMGKSKREGDGEVQEMIDMADFAVGLSRMLNGVTLPSERPQHRLFEQWHPIGVVGVITAFNFPMAVWSWNAFLAAVCGNTVVWKPSSKVPLCALAVQNICNHVMQEHNMLGVFSLMIPRGHQISEHFVSDKRVALMSFTGSCSVGQKVNEKVASRMGRVLLELGGNNAVIVDESADLTLVIPALVFGAVGTAGQRCTSTRRVFIHESLYDKAVKALSEAYRQIKIGDPLDTKNHMGPLVDQGAVINFETAIETCKAQGGKILFGGHALKQKGCFVEPTLVEARHDMGIVQQETFAPILYLMRYNDLREVIRNQNDVTQGLSSSLFTNDLRQAELFLSVEGSDCGIANINIGTSGAEIGGAFGGEKATGGGREAGSDSWKAYMRRQTNTINWGTRLPLAQGITFKI